MRRKFARKSGISNPRALLAFTLCSVGALLAGFTLAEKPPSSGTIANSPERPSYGEEQTGLYRGMAVAYQVKNGKAIFQGDIILEKVDRVSPIDLDSFGIAYTQYLWPKVGNQYQIPYIIGAGSGNLTNLNTAISQFNSTFSNIKFVARTTETDYVNFYFDPGDNSGQCEANAGRIGGQQQVGGAGGSFVPCLAPTILHEMGHTVGLWHEHTRPDRDTYLAVNYNNVIKGSRSNFDQTYDNQQQATLFDYASLMGYPAFTFTRNGNPVIETIPAGIPLSNPNGYSAADIDGIQRLYSQAPTSITVTSNPPGLQVIVDGVTVTTPHLYSNWTMNSTHTLAIPTGVQSLPGFIDNGPEPTTFYYTYGRWNDSTVASHSITVLPGNGAPSLPVSSPAVTTYSANFIQLVPYSATVFPASTGTVVPSPAPQTYPGSGLVFYVARQQATITATPNSGQNFYAFINAPYYLPGGTSANPKTFYVPDSGLTVNTTAQFSPDPVYTVNVAPGSFSSNHHIYADSTFYYAPQNFSAFYDSGWTPGTTHTLAVDDPEYPYSFATRFAFSSWSDGASTASHSVVLPATNTTYTANVTPQFYVVDSVYPGCAGSVNVTPSSPTNDGFYPTGTVLTFTETPNSGWTFAGWQYDLTGTSSPKLLTVTDEVFVATQYNTTTTPLTLTSLSPSEAVAGGPGFTLTLNGTGFTPSSPVSVNGTFPAVTFVNSTQLTVPVTAALIATPGVFQVWTDNFPSGAPCAAFVSLPFTVDTGPTPTVSPSATPVPTPTPSPTRTPTPTPTPTPSPTRTPSPTPTPTPSPTRTPSPTPTPTPSPTRTPSPTPPPTPSPTGTPNPSPTPSPNPTPTPTPAPTPTPTATPPLISISGTTSYCSNPVPAPVPNVALGLTGSMSGSTLSDASGNYSFTGLISGGNYTVTPTKTGLAPGSAPINTIDVVATQRHFLTVTPLTGCRLTAGDVNGDSAVNTIDVVAIQRFFLGQSTGIANVGKYQFSPVSRTYSGIASNQTGQNYDTLAFGDVASPFAH